MQKPEAFFVLDFAGLVSNGFMNVCMAVTRYIGSDLIDQTLRIVDNLN
jgi:hypothetical protein